MQTLRGKKVTLIDILSANPESILQDVQQNEIITRRDYNNLNHINHTKEKIVTNLLDTVMNKGELMCRKFLEVLQQKEVQETFPQLRELFIPAPAPPPERTNNGAKAPDKVAEYKMSSIPRGFCLIINNIKFDPPLSERRGSMRDEESIKEVFTKLGFTLDVFRNQNTEEMKALLESYSQKQHAGDCFVCFILSHGSKNGVHGTDGGIVSKDDIFGPFSGMSCQSLVNKPKAFFIQACRGKNMKMGVQIQSDSYEEEKFDVEDEETDSFEMATIPDDADFLIVRSTTKGEVSFRHTSEGSWFIQALCKQLTLLCPKGEDIQSILLCVNNEVSEKAAKNYKQMPIHKVTLRKKLVFCLPDQQ